MGKGSTTSQSNVIKKPRQYSGDIEAVASASGGTFDSTTANACLISFTEKIKFSDESGNINPGLKFVIIAVDGRILRIISGSRILGEYRGTRASLLRQCLAAGYIYQGTIQSMNADKTATCLVAGLGKI